MIWAQTGYTRQRFSQAYDGISAGVHWGIFFEVSAGADYHLALGPAPGNGTHDYQVDLDKATGVWTALYDSNTWNDQHGNPSSFQTDGWKNQTGTRASWTAEIYVTESDMVGTDGNRCNFTNCQFKCDGANYQDAGLLAGDVQTDNAAEWGAQYVSGTAFNVWDVHPLP